MPKLPAALCPGAGGGGWETAVGTRQYLSLRWVRMEGEWDQGLPPGGPEREPGPRVVAQSPGHCPPRAAAGPAR